MVWAHVVALFALLLGILTGMIYLTAIDNVITGAADSGFTKNLTSTHQPSYLRKLVFQQINDQVHSVFDANDEPCYFEGTAHDSTGSLVVPSSLSNPIACPGSDRAWFESFVNNQCYKSDSRTSFDGSENSSVGVLGMANASYWTVHNCAGTLGPHLLHFLTLHCLVPATLGCFGGGSTNSSGTNSTDLDPSAPDHASCVYCRCRQELSDILHKVGADWCVCVRVVSY
jgi:hypothetical protein